MNEYYILSINNEKVGNCFEIFFSYRNAIDYAIEHVLNEYVYNMYFQYFMDMEDNIEDRDDYKSLITDLYGEEIATYNEILPIDKFVDHYKNKIKNADELTNFFNNLSENRDHHIDIFIEKRSIKDEKDVNKKCKKIQKLAKQKLVRTKLKNSDKKLQMYE